MKKGFLLFMIFPLCFVLFINTAYKHQHVLPDGQKIVHAHPFQSCPNSCNDADHEHTRGEILLYKLISDSHVIAMFLPFFMVVYRIRESDSGDLFTQTYFSNAPVLHNLLRAPPLML